MSHPKFILVSRPETPLIGTFVYGMVGQHKELAEGYVKVHGGGWYLKDDVHKTITLYGSSGDYGEPRLAFLYTPVVNLPGNPLDLSDVEWF